MGELIFFHNTTMGNDGKKVGYFSKKKWKLFHKTIIWKTQKKLGGFFFLVPSKQRKFETKRECLFHQTTISLKEVKPCLEKTFNIRELSNGTAFWADLSFSRPWKGLDHFPRETNTWAKRGLQIRQVSLSFVREGKVHASGPRSEDGQTIQEDVCTKQIDCAQLFLSWRCCRPLCVKRNS